MRGTTHYRLTFNCDIVMYKIAISSGLIRDRRSFSRVNNIARASDRVIFMTSFADAFALRLSRHGGGRSCGQDVSIDAFDVTFLQRLLATLLSRTRGAKSKRSAPDRFVINFPISSQYFFVAICDR